jgi:hypothetical protein
VQTAQYSTGGDAPRTPEEEAALVEEEFEKMKTENVMFDKYKAKLEAAKEAGKIKCVSFSYLLLCMWWCVCPPPTIVV